MNKTLLIILAVLALIAAWIYVPRGGQGGDIASSTPEVPAESTKAAAPIAAAPKAPAKTTPKAANAPVASSEPEFLKVFKQPGSHMCEYSQVTPSGQSTYRIYISGGKMRGEFYAMGSTGTLVIYNGSLLYSWKEGSATGSKSPLTSLSQIPVAIPSDLQSGAVYGKAEENVSWDCHPWIPDTSLFAPPSYVHFSS